MIWAGEEHGALGVFHIKIEEKKNKEQYKYLKLAVFKEKDQSEIGQLLLLYFRPKSQAEG